MLFLSWALWPTAGQDDPKFNVVQILSTLAGAFASFVTINKFIGGFDARSERTAAAIQDLDIDPTEPLKQRFEEMIRDIHNPVAVFIDDPDRCDAAYVIELLQAIQTIYVDVPALYVVAADRDWIVSAYDQVYKDFKPEIDTPGQPLGYLFVKKIFQLSVNVPNLDDAYGRAFMKANLPGEAEEDALTEAEEKALQEEIANAPTLAAAERIVEAQTIPGSQRLAGRAIFRKAMTSEAQEELGHVLLDALTKDEMLIDLNPRAIKRLVNAYAFRWGFARSIGDRAIIPKLPYWCALDLRFPYAAERLMDNPDLRNDGAWQSDSEARFFPKRDHDAIGALLDHVDEADIRAFRALG